MICKYCFNKIRGWYNVDSAGASPADTNVVVCQQCDYLIEEIRYFGNMSAHMAPIFITEKINMCVYRIVFRVSQEHKKECIKRLSKILIL